MPVPRMGVGLTLRFASCLGTVTFLTVALLVTMLRPAGTVPGPAYRVVSHSRPAAGAAALATTSVDATAPGSLGHPDGVQDVFWRGGGSALMHVWYVPGLGWQPAQRMGGTMLSGPDPVASGNGVMDVFWQGFDGNLWHVWYVAGVWYGPQDLGMGPLGSAPQAVSPQTGVLNVFWRGTNGGLWYGWFVSGAWHGPSELLPGGSLASDPDPVSDANGTIQVFYKGPDGNAHMASYHWQWAAPVTLPGPIGSMPHAVLIGNSQMDLMWQGADGGLWYDTFNGSAWAGPDYGSAGTLGSQPHAVSTVTGRADVYWRGTNGWLWTEQIMNGAPQHLQELPTNVMGSEPEPDVLAPGNEDVDWLGTNAGIWHEWGDGSSVWAGPQEVAAPPPSTISLAVPFYHQQESLTCEEAALRMSLAYFGIGISEQQVLNAEGVDLVHYWTGAGGGDPFADFVGNPNGSEIANTGYGSYWSAISRATADLGGIAAWAGMGLSPGSVYNYVLAGQPVIFWVPYDWDTPARHDYTAFDGRSIPYAGPEEHAMVVIGVSPTQVEVNDPDRGQYWVSKSQFQANYAVYGDMAVVIR